MNLQTEEVGDILVVKVPPMDLDAGNADEFKKSASPLVTGHTHVIMDLSGVGFMDSAGLGAVLSVFKKVRSDGGQFRAFGLSDEVRGLFELVRMHRLFGVYPDKESAISSFENQ